MSKQELNTVHCNTHIGINKKDFITLENACCSSVAEDIKENTDHSSVVQNIHFNKCNFDHEVPNITFINCTFTNCKFYPNSWRKNYNCLYINCEFNHVAVGNIETWDCVFQECEFNNSILEDNLPDILDGIKGNWWGNVIVDGEIYNTKGWYSVIPDGNFVGYKKALYQTRENDHLTTKQCIIGLLINSNNVVYCKGLGKMRTREALVCSIEDLETGKQLAKANSWYDKDFLYIINGIVAVDDFNKNRQDVCSAGIHFFLTKAEAKNYKFN